MILRAQAAVLATFWAATAGAVPMTMGYAGFLSDATGPVNGPTNITFSLYDEEFAVTPLWTETASVGVQGGYFSLQLGTFTPIPPTAFAGPLFLGVQVEGDAEMTPRAFVGSIPFAIHAAVADTVTGNINVGSIAVGGVPIVNSMGTWIGSPTNLQGPAGVSCWDFNMNGTCDLPTEDPTNDSACSVADCNGVPGPAGAACWDLDASGTCGPGEDYNGDFLCDMYDCRAVDGTGNLMVTGNISAGGALTTPSANVGGISINSGNISMVNSYAGASANFGTVNIDGANITGVSNYSGASANIGGVNLTNTGDVFATGGIGANTANIGGVSITAGSVAATSFFGALSGTTVAAGPILMNGSTGDISGVNMFGALNASIGPITIAGGDIGSVNQLAVSTINIGPGGSLNMSSGNIGGVNSLNANSVSTTSGANIGGPLTAANISSPGPVEGNEVRLAPMATGCFGRRVLGTSPGFFNGAQGGYLGGNTACAPVANGAMMCTYQEIMESIRCGVMPQAGGPNGWYNGGGSSDCQGWSAGSNGFSGNAWSPTGFPQLVTCDTTLAVMCCQ